MGSLFCKESSLMFDAVVMKAGVGVSSCWGGPGSGFLKIARELILPGRDDRLLVLRINVLRVAGRDDRPLVIRINVLRVVGRDDRPLVIRINVLREGGLMTNFYNLSTQGFTVQR
jgi:hypothetical protein